MLGEISEAVFGRLIFHETTFSSGILVVTVVILFCSQAVAAQPRTDSMRVTLSDLVLAARCMTGQITHIPAEMQAIDPDANGRITLSDLVALAKTCAAQPAAPEGTVSPLPTTEPGGPGAAPSSESSALPAATKTPVTSGSADADAVDGEAAAVMEAVVGGTVFSATLADTQAAHELADILSHGPLTIRLHAYGGFEMVGELGRSLITDRCRAQPKFRQNRY